MKIAIESTDKFTYVRGQMCRVWHGLSEDGIPCDLAIALVRVANEDDGERFARELRELSDPDEGMVVDMRYIW